MNARVHHLCKKSLGHMRYIYTIINSGFPHIVHLVIRSIEIIGHICKNRFIIYVLSKYIRCNIVKHFVMFIRHISKYVICHLKKPGRSRLAASIPAYKFKALRIHSCLCKCLYKSLRILVWKVICIHADIFVPEIIILVICVIIFYHPWINLISVSTAYIVRLLDTFVII